MSRRTPTMERTEDTPLHDEHARLRQEVRAFADSVVGPDVAQMQASGSVNHPLIQEIARRGWIGVTVPKEHGGMEAGHLAKTIIIEELSRVSAAVGAAAQASQLGVAMILHYGSSRQQKTWLPKVARGTCLPTIATTEPGSGSHVLGMQMTARREDRFYILDGVKTHVGNSHVGDLHGVVARTGEGGRGLSAFLVSADTPGVVLEPHRERAALRGFSYGTIRFENCRIPVGSRLGKEGDGRDAADASSVLYGRLNLAAVALGIQQALVDLTAAHLNGREMYGRTLADLGALQQQMGRMVSRLRTTRTLLYAAARDLDSGCARDADLFAAKHVAVDGAGLSARDAMELHGAEALFADHPVSRLIADANAVFAPAGTGHVQLKRLAESVLGPRRDDYATRFAPSVRQKPRPNVAPAALSYPDGGADAPPAQ
ncbi:acyl-CoA dehydrogenase family protein [Streptomyces sp. NPDC088768]|uniref:acyl-CoA dehydrogenase family protein n=1 Tax=Streptomyces sp. NPDC088768 TaxID=3365894 RepID=UPI00381FC6F2